MTEHRWVFARGWREEGTGNSCLVDMGLPSGVMKMSWNYIGVVAIQHCEHYCFVVDLKMVNSMVYAPYLDIFSRMEEGGRER